MLSLADRIRSAHYALWLGVSERLGRARGPVREVPAVTLAAAGLPPAVQARIAALAARHGVAFEARLGLATALENYARLDLLDQAYAAWGRAPSRGGTLHDVGSASFWYAATLAAFYAPAHLVGIELEGYRRLRGRRNRCEQALGYVADLAGAEFVVADYTTWQRPATLATAFFPFVTPAPVLAWRLPLSVLAPQRLFGRLRANLAPAGELLMVNHGLAEAGLAAGHARSAGLVRRDEYVCTAPLLPRPEPAVVSRWTPGG